MRKLGQFERLKIPGKDTVVTNCDQKWESIRMPDHYELGRSLLGTCPVSRYEILIFGGYSLKDRISNIHWLYDIRTQ